MRALGGSKVSMRLGVLAGAALWATASGAMAGGFQINEQSTVFLGSASSGVAAGGSIGSMYWNPAAAGQFSGLNTESSYTLVLPHADVTVTDGTTTGPTVFPPFFYVGDPNSGDIGIEALTSSTFGTYQLSKDLWVGMALNSPFGLSTKPEDTAYLGSYLGVTAKVLTINANPMLAYRIAPGITVGAGVQIEWGRGKLQYRVPIAGIGEFVGDDWAVGGTAGILIEPAAGTSIGLGYRSQMTHDLQGHFRLAGLGVPAEATLNLPDIVTLSLRQAISPNMRLLGTVEWTNWSRFKQLELVTPNPAFNSTLTTNWSDGWYFSVGGEYDYSPYITLRGGVGYEITPEDAPEKVLTVNPDNDRVWLAIGASYKWSETTTFDVGYSHIFVKDGSFVRSPTYDPNIVLSGTFDAHADLISVGMRTRW
jgi:long-chain fatty acid transport protein